MITIDRKKFLKKFGTVAIATPFIASVFISCNSGDDSGNNAVNNTNCSTSATNSDMLDLIM